MNKLFRVCALAVLVFGAAVLWIAGCRMKPKLTSEQALALIQAQLDQQAPVSAVIMVNDTGMQEGVTAKYWDRSKAYPNKYWADFKLTAAGKKVVLLDGGGDTIPWHPESPADASYQITLSPVVANHLKAENAADPQSGVGGTETVLFDEVTSLKGVPEPVQQMARETHTKVAAQHTATFALSNGAWTLQSID